MRTGTGFSNRASWAARLVLAGLVAHGVAPVAAAADAGAVRLVAPAAEDHPYRLELAPEFARSWREVKVRRLAVRFSGGQRSLEPRFLPASGPLELELPRHGCSLVETDLELPGTSRPVRRSAKFVVCPPQGSVELDRAARRRAAALLTEKTGAELELRPLLNPATLDPGADLAVRVYRGGRVVPGARLVAAGPTGERAVTADAHGIAVVRIDAAGPWTLGHGDEASAAELHLDVRPEAAR